MSSDVRELMSFDVSKDNGYSVCHRDRDRTRGPQPPGFEQPQQPGCYWFSGSDAALLLHQLLRHHLRKPVEKTSQRL